MLVLARRATRIAVLQDRRVTAKSLKFIEDLLQCSIFNNESLLHNYINHSVC